MITVYTHFYTASASDCRHRVEHALGRKLLERGLLELYGLAPSSPDTELMDGPHGKPLLCRRPDIFFNISHCDGLAVCAFASSPVGIDAEHIRPFKDTLLRKVLTPEEQELLSRLGTEEASRQEWFFRFWTLKESRIKQSGTGMSTKLTDFSFSFEAPDRIRCSVPCLTFRQFDLPGGYILSVCSTEQEDEVHLVSCENL